MENYPKLTVRQIAGLVRECRRAGVKHFQYQGLSIFFGDCPEKEQLPQLSESVKLEEDRRVQRKNQLQRRHDEIVDDIDDLAISDPALYEEQLLRGGD